MSLEVMETKVCDKKGIALPTNPQEIEEMLRLLNESPQNLISVLALCAKHHEPAWHYNLDVFQDTKKINIDPVKHEEVKDRKLRIDGCDVVLTEEDGGGFSVACLSLPGCRSQGESEKEAIDNIKDAMKGYIAAAKKHGIPIRR